MQIIDIDYINLFIVVGYPLDYGNTKCLIDNKECEIYHFPIIFKNI